MAQSQKKKKGGGDPRDQPPKETTRTHGTQDSLHCLVSPTNLVYAERT